MQAIVSWSGGKDSCYAMLQAIALGYKPVALLNMMNEDDALSRSHGLTKQVLQAQALALNLPIITCATSWSMYEHNFVQCLTQATAQYSLHAAIFGDIDLQAHLDWEQKVCAQAGIKAVLPLWQHNRMQLVTQMLNSGMQAYIVSCNSVMGSSYLGQLLTPQLLTQLVQLGVDPCGENGEYHTVVTYCNAFAHSIPIQFGNTILHNNYWFINNIIHDYTTTITA